MKTAALQTIRVVVSIAWTRTVALETGRSRPGTGAGLISWVMMMSVNGERTWLRMELAMWIATPHCLRDMS